MKYSTMFCLLKFTVICFTVVMVSVLSINVYKVSYRKQYYFKLSRWRVYFWKVFFNDFYRKIHPDEITLYFHYSGVFFINKHSALGEYEHFGMLLYEHVDHHLPFVSSTLKFLHVLHLITWIKNFYQYY